MYPLQGGTQKIEMNKRTRNAVPSKEYEAMRDSMLRESQRMNQVERRQGAGMAAEVSRDPIYGATNIKTGRIMGGSEGAFAQGDDQGTNRGLENPMAQTGYLEGGVSSTIYPQTQPQLMGQQAMERVQGVLKGKGHNLNDINQIYRA